ncbi:MAG: 7-cyano-7-deazaguanine synthase QueC [Oscillospiraceae bacterium]|nr:7-cyano-7-deazaguanine synthase QueC [Oscillospiraceae bacterium]
MKKIVLLSGGVDSTTCLAVALQDCEPKDVMAVNMYYGQKHRREIESARRIAAYYGVEIMEVDMSPIFSKSDCSLLASSDKAIPHESYADQQKETGGQPVSTYVPFRNGLMLSAAASIAVSVGASLVYYGAHADDAAGNAYPDCSVPFTDAINRAIYEGTGGKVSIIAPFVTFNKAQVVKTGLELGVPYKMTWSCYEGGEKPCGKCGTCIDRAKAFAMNGVDDLYE